MHVPSLHHRATITGRRSNAALLMLPLPAVAAATWKSRGSEAEAGRRVVQAARLPVDGERSSRRWGRRDAGETTRRRRGRRGKHPKEDDKKSCKINTTHPSCL